MKIKKLKITYLNRIQLEEEGWKFSIEINKWSWYSKDIYRMSYMEKLPYNINGYLKIYMVDESGFCNDCLFNGKCDDINTFRKIFNLIKI